MLILDYKLRTNQAQQRALDEVIRTVQFIRNKCLRLSHGWARHWRQ
jgi:putative transposase